MPNSRRRKFSVRNGKAGRGPSKLQNGLQTGDPGFDHEIQTTINNTGPINCPITQYKMNPDSSSNSNNSDIVECPSSTSMVTVKKRSNTTVDRDVTASSSNIDLFNLMYITEDLTCHAEPWKDNRETTNIIGKIEPPLKRITDPVNREKKREKYRQHRIKVRSPRCRIGVGILDPQNKINNINKQSNSIGTETIAWERTADNTSGDNVVNVVETIEDDERQSDHSSDDMCRICHGGDALSLELGQLISACSCRGTVGRVHVKCLERWLTESGKSKCELCGTRYATRRVHRYGVPRALVMWILSQNAKQLMVDSLGIMLMSPLAVLAAWLSGRTLAGLMTQDAHATPWPLASTFVLACMTLVCYYCWIVSAATRHALGWWIWYRSQYEVRLQLLDSEE